MTGRPPRTCMPFRLTIGSDRPQSFLVAEIREWDRVLGSPGVFKGVVTFSLGCQSGIIKEPFLFEVLRRVVKFSGLSHFFTMAL